MLNKISDSDSDSELSVIKPHQFYTYIAVF